MVRIMDNNLIKLRKIKLDILKEFIRVSEIKKTIFFSIGVTRFGVIWQEGLIPWVEDMDFNSVRKKKSKNFQSGNHYYYIFILIDYLFHEYFFVNSY